jgi:hypothetical protein
MGRRTNTKLTKDTKDARCTLLRKPVLPRDPLNSPLRDVFVSSVSFVFVRVSTVTP